MPIFTPREPASDYSKRALKVGQSIVKGNAVGFGFATQTIQPIQLPTDSRRFAFLGIATKNHKVGSILHLEDL